MSKFFKFLSDITDFFEKPRMMLTCPVPPRHGGCSDVRCVGIHNALLIL